MGAMTVLAGNRILLHQLGRLILLTILCLAQRLAGRSA